MMLDADVQRRPDTELWQWLKALWGSCPREAGCCRLRQTKARREMLDICAVIIQTGHISMGACVEY
jgi:hypothetical protein